MCIFTSHGLLNIVLESEYHTKLLHIRSCTLTQYTWLSSTSHKLSWGLVTFWHGRGYYWSDDFWIINHYTKLPDHTYSLLTVFLSSRLNKSAITDGVSSEFSEGRSKHTNIIDLSANPPITSVNNIYRHASNGTLITIVGLLMKQINACYTKRILNQGHSRNISDLSHPGHWDWCSPE